MSRRGEFVGREAARDVSWEGASGARVRGSVLGLWDGVVVVLMVREAWAASFRAWCLRLWGNRSCVEDGGCEVCESISFEVCLGVDGASRAAELN
jgi:hypothetical protein